MDFAGSEDFRDLEASGIEFRHLIVLEAAARHGQLVLAAEELGISPSHVSRSITQIEEILGTRLCERSRAGVFFTEPGKLFLARVREVLSAANRTLQFGKELASLEAGILRIGIIPAAVKFGIQEHVSRVRVQHPNVQFKVDVELASATLIDALITDELDVAYLEPPIEDPSLESIEVGRSGWSLAMAPDHELAQRESLKLTDLNGLTLFQDMPQFWAEGHAQLIRLCRQQGFVPNLDYSQFNGFTRLILVGAGIGFSISPSVFGTDSFDRTVYVPIDEPEMAPFTLCAVWRRESPNPMVAQWASQLVK